MKLYLDICSLKRPFDDQIQARIRLESEAVLEILKNADLGIYFLVGSDVLHLENKRDPDYQRYRRTAELLKTVSEQVALTDSAKPRGNELVTLGFRPMDALHLACAESANVEVFITCDDQLLRVAHRNADNLKVQVLNPVEFIRSADHGQ